MALVELAGMKTELLQYDNIAVPDESSPGYAHLAFRVEHLDALLERVSLHGWKTPGQPQTIAASPLKGTRVIYVMSPDGQTLEFNE